MLSSLLSYFKARRWLQIAIYSVVILLIALSTIIFLLAQKPTPKEITYGMSFNTMYAREIGLDWKETYDAIIDDLGVRDLRLAAHWPMVEPQPDVYNFSELDYQIEKAKSVGARVILAVGRRLPRWPECHIPNWAKDLEIAERQEVQLKYITEVINRYKDNPAIVMWQLENEPFLKVFAFEHCGELDVDFLTKEKNLIKELDSSRQILVTDSGNLGTWAGAYSQGDAFGTSVYVHFWNADLGQFRTLLPPWVYVAKENLMANIYGKKPTMLIELSAEPWLLEPIIKVPVEVQFTRMNLEKFEDILHYAEETKFDKQYLWGAEWWYWLKLNNYPEMWERGKKLFPQAKD